jgi:O-succinylbenzoate synthase
MEQPLDVGELPQMLALAQEFTTPLALDESVANLRQLKYCYEQGWRSIFVIKPAIIGYPYLLRQFCQEYTIDTVFSSVFETAIARQACLQLAQELMVKNRALGFGDGHWFKV